MKNYTVYFEIFGNKMKTTVLTDSRTKAIAQVKAKLNIISVKVDKKDSFNKSVDYLDKILDILK